MCERFGTYGAWLNPGPGDAPFIEYTPSSKGQQLTPTRTGHVGAARRDTRLSARIRHRLEP
uniref:Uncharacterized protein n=1 Tax=Rhodococcus hoagii TaxID=43767 RepID=A0A1Z1UXG0_RHOHA|nr:hypothetical protein pVAPN1572_1101 [Prescottella equi]